MKRPTLMVSRSPLAISVGRRSIQSDPDLPELLQRIDSGDINTVRILIEQVGTDVNTSDCHGQSALHYAAYNGDVALVQYLISKGAKVNALDQLGETPLAVACQNRHSECAMYLRVHGAKLTISPQETGASLCQAASKGDIAALETLLNSPLGNAPHTDPNTADYDGRTALHIAAGTGRIDVVRYLLDQGADVNSEDRWGNNAWLDAKRSGFQDICDLLEERGATLPKAGSVALDAVPGELKCLASGATQEHMDKTFENLMENGLYREEVLKNEVSWYYNVLDFHRFYFERFSPVDVSQHIESYIAAKKLAASSGRAQDVYISVEGPDHAFYICPNEHNSMVVVEKSIEKVINSHLEDGFAATHFKSKGIAVPEGSTQLAIYVLDKSPFLSHTMAPGSVDLSQVATHAFKESKMPDVVERYQEVVTAAVSHLSPAMHIFPPHWDGSIPVMFGFRRESLRTSLAQITELFRTHNLSCERKMVETFGNGVIVYSFYFAADSNMDEINEFVEQVGVLFLVPPSQILMPLYLSGEFTAKEFAYAVAIKKFAYYFLSQDNDDLKSLLDQLKGDPVHQERVLSLRRLMRHEHVTEDFVAHIIAKYPDVIEELFEDFSAISSPDSEHAPCINPKLHDLIAKVALNDEDLTVLTIFLRFNASVLKTNFHKFPKSNISFRLSPSIIGELDLEVPFGLFFVMANDFQGFHIRFGDIARGGIRAIKSDTQVVYGRNKESQFMENYNLAHTQMRKNKDIPEAGSKGTILLGPGLIMPKHVEYAFRKYVSGLLDLLLPHPQIVDHYGQTEILFLGPDENTADLMEWAALYAKRRGYQYWKAFTTGKPPSLGGVPHDTYGMTTRSVHKYVTEALAKNNLDESRVTKLQTGGPDGDLGSNEILISKDRTIAVVDVSGVLYDPQGLDREALSQLAHDRATVKHFDTSKLSDGGFLVLQDERSRQLPNGEVVDGRVFRDEFHLHPLSTADLFVPCGGRPESINAKNVKRMFHEDGVTPRFKFVVEGANLFLTQDARLVLEKAGVTVFKDASANKGGVTSSSLEVLAALALTDSEALEHMSAEDPNNPPEFYKKYVEEIQTRVEENAWLEFHCIWDEAERRNLSRVQLTDVLSDRINEMNASITASDLYERRELRNSVLKDAVPSLLTELVGGLDVLLERVPDNYMRAIFNKYLASRFIYTCGIAADHVAFYQFMEDYVKGRVQARQAR